MGVPLIYIVVMLVAYVAVVLGVGIWAGRQASRSPDEYFLAGRSLGTFVLFMALFGTNATAFVLVGIPGRAYHDGIGTFSVNAPIIALMIPMTFWAIGSPARRMAKRLGALTPAELYARRFDSRGIGALLFAVFTAYTLPYMVTAVMGAAVALHVVADVPTWVGGLGVLGVALVYTSIGGMRATAWTNVIQGLIFVVFVVVAIVFIAHSLGGVSEAMQSVEDTNPDLLRLGDRPLFGPEKFASWGLAIGLTVIAFPHMLVRLMAGDSDRTLRSVSRLYPPALLILWLPVVLIGVWGAAGGYDLIGRQSDKIFSIMTAQHLPPILVAMGFLAVLSAVMSTLDAQILTLGSMLTRDVLDPLMPSKTRDDVMVGRVFGVIVAAIVYVAAQLAGTSIFDIARVAFSGYVTLVPALLMGVRWRRFTAPGAAASIVVGNLVLVAGELAWIPLGGFLPVFWAFFAAIVAGVGTSLATPPSADALTRRAFG